MSGRCISFVSAKGGSGKTTITASIASFLCEIGKKVIVIDCDEATYGMTLLYLHEIIQWKHNIESSNDYLAGLFDYVNLSLEDNLTKILKLSILTTSSGFQLIPATLIFNRKNQMEPDSFNSMLLNIVQSAKE